MSAILDSPFCLKNLKFRFKLLLLIIVYEKKSHEPKSADLKEFVHGERRLGWAEKKNFGFFPRHSEKKMCVSKSSLIFFQNFQTIFSRAPAG